MGRCKNPGHRRWRVVKRDGVWQAFDPDGDLRYAAEHHRMVMAFVMAQPKPQRSYVILDPEDLVDGATSWQDVMRRVIDHDLPWRPSDTKDTKAWEKQNKRDVWDVLSNPGDPEDYPEDDSGQVA